MSFTVTTVNVPCMGLRFRTAAEMEADVEDARKARKEARARGDDDPCIAIEYGNDSFYGITMPGSPLWRITPGKRDRTWSEAESAVRVLNTMFEKGEMRTRLTHQHVYELRYRSQDTGIEMPIEGLYWFDRDEAYKFCEALNKKWYENAKTDGANRF